MTDPVNLTVPADARFRGIAPEVGGRYVVAAGGSEADAGIVVEALNAAIETLTKGATEPADVELLFRVPGAEGGSDGSVEVTLTCQGKSSVVTHPLPAART
jgi:hypothetical protein